MMKQKYIFVTVAALFCLDHAMSEFQEGDSELDRFVDKIFEHLHDSEFAHRLDPAILPNRSVGIHIHTGLIRFESHAGFFDGSLTGLSTLKRSGEVTADQNEDGTLTIDAALGLDFLSINYTMLAQIYHFGPSLFLKANVTGMTVRMVLDIGLDGFVNREGKRKITIRKLEVVNPGKVHVTLHHNYVPPIIAPLVHKIWGKYVEAAATIINEVLAIFLPGPIKVILQAIINSVVDDLPDIFPDPITAPPLTTQ